MVITPSQRNHGEDIGDSVKDIGESVDEAMDASNPEMDIRPHIFDPVLKQFLLCDSGSMVRAFPPDPGDLPVRNQFLKAANGYRMACYGYKDISIKIGWKPYPSKIIKAQVESPIIGWDFMKHHKLDLRWNDSDQITIYDKTSKVSSVLHLKPIPIDQSSLMKNLSLVKSEPEYPGGKGLENPEVLLGEVSAIEALDKDNILEAHDEKINILPDSEY